ncbi:DoxX family protein [Burkholderia cenocepacia]|uniref:DoxX family protein n=1 Tax=Burkholderia cenocepacia TaxID=95486 RepID=UPI000F5891DC|nr:DoxX family protein [Burkholderia cenocepacia]RQU38960.1 DoxX family protein [Burkholderia cenocepacia]RQU63186.1 DoxX family protein [Burkholderia cenocepacia]
MTWAHLKAIIAAALDWVRFTGAVAAPPVARIALALPFLRSGLTRWDGWLALSPATTFLFEERFRLHVFGGAYMLPWPDLLAYMVGCAETIVPVLLIVGLATRLSALGLLLMTGVIQLVFPEGWANFHLYWAALALSVMALGPGWLSLDYLVQLRRSSTG